MSNIALNGLDPVALMAHSQRLIGKPQFKIRHRAKIFVFATQHNLEVFRINPDRYSPQLDGLCPVTYALTGKQLKGDPNLASVVGDRLFFYSKPYHAWICRLIPWVLRRAVSRYEQIHQVVVEESLAA